MPDDTRTKFEEAASQDVQPTLLCELWQFLTENKKWWLLPILLVLLMLGMLMVLAGGAATPFIYAIF